ncbi:4-hydroxy-3-methylbut-2-enyl diphosphate reductase [Lentzea tibetensis]|uniref:4-hydroxy-3-methylbut-2-enyl diphosphate reductase n=1 Tax=Lentzea tibetensis TaxID=2591470 RepID=UPI001F256679|nr:4-hydroxy-3-methylbut-2-enyl diphosphate reductase [Lentzea tibetensis]
MGFPSVVALDGDVLAVRIGTDSPAVRVAAACPSAPILLGELRRRGVEASVVDALDVDERTAELLERFTADPRVVFECSETQPAVLDALRAWAAAAGDRHVLLAGPRSFCAGVERAIEIVERVLGQCGAPVYVRKQIVHNVHVVRELEERGAVFVDELDEVPPSATVIFSAHGVSPAVREEAARRDLRVVDATCPLVTKVHSEAKRFAQRGDTIVLIGHAGHEESEGTLGEVPGMLLVEKPDDVRELDLDGPVSFLMQTTLAVDEAAGVVDALRTRFPQLTGPHSDDICYATTNRQDSLRAVAADAELVLVVGSVNSSNSLRLVELARRSGCAAHLIDDVTDLDPAWLVGVRTVGLTAGASAPPRLVTEVIDALRGLGAVTVEERQVAVETIHFGLPRNVR